MKKMKSYDIDYQVLPAICARSAALVCAASMMLFAGQAGAQVYKCTIDGKVTFSDRQCEAGQAPESIRPSMVIRTDEEFKRDQQRAARASEPLPRVAPSENLPGGIVRAPPQRAQPDDVCKTIRRQMNEANYWANEFVTRENVRREQDKAKALRDRLWWECKENP
jgi:hypothetical protein